MAGILRVDLSQTRVSHESDEDGTVYPMLLARLSRGVLVSHERLRDLRLRRILTQEELAEKAGVARSTVIKLEQADGEARQSTIRKLARALGLKDPNELRPPR